MARILRFFVALIAAAAIVAGVFHFSGGLDLLPPPDINSDPRTASVSAAPTGQPSPTPLPDPVGISPLQDPANLTDILIRYREQFEGLPAGETNAQIVNVLTGNNPDGIAFIERSDPAINVRGELTDRWATPFFFHNISRNALEIRSAGPDRSLWTADDILTQFPATHLAPPTP